MGAHQEDPENSVTPQNKAGSEIYRKKGETRRLCVPVVWPGLRFVLPFLFSKSLIAANLTVARDRECSGFSGFLLRIISTITSKQLSEQFFQELFLQALWFRGSKEKEKQQKEQEKKAGERQSEGNGSDVTHLQRSPYFTRWWN